MSTSDTGGDAQAPEDGSSTCHQVESPEAFPPKRKKSPSPRNCREFIRRQAASAMPEIVETFVKKAKGGSVPHFTSLAKVGGFDQKPSASDASRRQRRSLARQLLDEVERYEAQQTAELAEANRPLSIQAIRTTNAPATIGHRRGHERDGNSGTKGF